MVSMVRRRLVCAGERECAHVCVLGVCACEGVCVVVFICPSAVGVLKGGSVHTSV